MRIGMMVRNLEEKGGIAVYAQALLENLLAIDSSNDYVLYYGDERSRGKFARSPNVTEVVLPCRNKLWWDQVQVARDANRRDLDLIFCPKMSLPFFFRGKKTMAIHGAEQFVFRKEFGLGDRFYVQTFLPMYARAADVVLVPAETSRDDLVRELHVPDDRFEVNPYGAKSVFSEPVPAARIAEVRRRYDLEGDFLLHVGLIWGAKNFGILPEVLDRVNRVNRGRKIVLAHAGKLHRWTNGTCDALHPGIRGLGYVPDEDLAALYQSATAFVFPSLYEGFGIPLVEAMAAGCPVIAARWGAMAEICDDAAVLVDVHDPGEIADAAIRFAESAELRAEYARKGRERAKRYTWARTARQTLDTFERLVAPKSERAASEHRVPS